MDMPFPDENIPPHRRAGKWLTVHSLATLTVTGGCPYSEREIEQILTGISLSICRSIKEVPGFTENSYDRDTLFRALVDE